MASLFELDQHYAEVLKLAEQGADAQLIQDTLESIEDEIEDKADGYAAVIKRLEGNIDMITKEEQRLKAVKASHKDSITRMKRNLIDSMKMKEKTSFKTGTHNFFIKKNRVGVEILEEKLIPKEFMAVTEKADKEKIKEYMQKNNLDTFAGARLSQGETVVIK